MKQNTLQNVPIWLENSKTANSVVAYTKCLVELVACIEIPLEYRAATDEGVWYGFDVGCIVAELNGLWPHGFSMDLGRPWIVGVAGPIVNEGQLNSHRIFV